MRKTKIVCTIGPASEKPEVLRDLITLGLDVARLNFSHGTYEEHGARIKLIREISKELGKDVAILLDTKGPEIRTIDVENGAVELIPGEEIILTTEEILGNAKRVSITYKGLPDDVEAGSRILIDDGTLELVVEKVVGGEIYCRIITGGILKNHKGVNVPGVKVRLPGITEKDAEDIRFGIEQGVDFIAASFVRKAADIYDIRKILEEHGADIEIIAKIESEEGVQNAEEILAVSDGLMVARGDLGVEIPAEDVPLIQKRLIAMCNAAGKPVITATQMLDSMQRNPRPTRAEASDVANAILDGTDAIMLSGETAAGKYPRESVRTMARIAERTESAYGRELAVRERGKNASMVTITGVISEAVARAAVDLQAAAILAPTESGYTARMISKNRPNLPILAVTPHGKVIRKLKLVWGVYPIRYQNEQKSTDEMMEQAVELALESGMVKRGDLIVITAGVPLREPGTTNLMKIHVIGDVIGKGQGIGNQIVTGKVVTITDPKDLKGKETEGTILVTKATDQDMMEIIGKVKAIVTEEGGLTSHAAIVGVSMGIPVIVGVEKATEILKDGLEVTVDASHGHIYIGQAKVL
ncbi:pyruvate kinase [Thermicanus aegyptius]|uniref:pyruvate kinase n=1 Tax=Thermicanus aegyptius TaxID=94009 RepID=UPI00041C4E0E|nr:pyruvate kinase [Thermicanus aegyptius]